MIKVKLGKAVTSGTCECGAPSVCLVDDALGSNGHKKWLEWCNIGHVYVCIGDPSEEQEVINGTRIRREAEAKAKGQLVFDFGDYDPKKE